MTVAICSTEIRRLHALYEEIRSQIEADVKSLDEEIDYVNPFWQDTISNRRTSLDFNNALRFLQNDLASRVGSLGQSNREIDRQMYEDTVTRLLQEAPREYVTSFDESWIGMPAFFTSDSIVGSRSFMDNLVGSYQITELVKRFLPGKREINVLEIGAGWGAVAFQLLKHLPIRNYAICDLHENMFLSSFFLRANFPDRCGTFVIDKETPLGENGLLFCSPRKLKLIDGEFDLIINMQSFQEMFARDARDYVSFAAERLSSDGILYSENGTYFTSTQRAQKASDYGYCDQFKVLSLEYGRRHCPHLFNGSKHEIVLRKRQDKEKPHDSDMLDGICNLLQARLDSETSELRDAFLKHTLTESQEGFLRTVNTFFAAEHVSDKNKALEQMERFEYVAITAFLRALLSISQYHFADALKHLDEALTAGLAGRARVNALLFKGLLENADGERRKGYIQLGG